MLKTSDSESNEKEVKDEIKQDQNKKTEEEEAEAEEPSLSNRFRRSPWTEPTKDPVAFKKLLRTFLPDVMVYRSTLARTAVAFFMAALIRSLFPMATKFVIDYLIPSANFTLLWVTALSVVVLYLLLSVIIVMAHNLLIYASTHIVFRVRRKLFQHLQLLHLAFYEREQSGKLVAKLINDVSAIQMLIQSALPVLTVSCFTIIVTFLLMSTLSVKLTLLAMVIIPVYFLISRAFRSRLYRRSMEVRERNSVVAGNLNEVISGIKVVKSFGMEDQEQRRFVRMIRENLDYEIDLGTTNAMRGSSLEFITGVALAGTMLIGGTAAMNDTMPIGSYVAFLAYLRMLYQPVLQIANLTIQIVQARTGLERVYNILNIKPEVVDRPHARELHKIEGVIEFENVGFHYSESEKVLHDIDLVARPGEIVALVGPSGSGKSTIVNLLTRFYDVTEGRILLDGIDLRNISMKSYRNHYGIVLQDPFLFSGTIFDNICYSRGTATYEEVEEAARQANALEFINELPDGFETQVGERGALLSGGQRQRISIARALLKDPDILILDEATSALDAESEAKVQEALDRLMKGRTVFVIAHRLSTIKNANKIVVLNQGRIESIGTHAELISSGGIYAKLYAQSFQGLSPEALAEAPAILAAAKNEEEDEIRQRDSDREED
ncbi:MAG: ABC transporter ATP-binding protein [Candidatus Sumerlaeia bacterium]